MFKSNHNLIIKAEVLGLILVGILALGAIFTAPKSAEAYLINGGYTLEDNADYSIDNATSYGVSPTVYYITPARVVTGTANRTIDISGLNFLSSSVARIDGKNRATTYVNQNHLTMELKKSDLENPGVHSITVYTPNYGGGISNEAVFRVEKPRNTGGAGTTTNGNNTSNNGTSVDNSDESTITDEDGVDLSANVFNSGFMPHTFLGWLALVILIVIITLLFRKLYISEKDKHVPLKHA